MADDNGISSTVGLHGSSSPITDGVPFYRTERILRDQILLCLRRVIDPDLGQDIVACNFVKELVFSYDEGSVSFNLELTTAACPVKDVFVDECTRILTDTLDWVQSVDVTVSSRADTASSNHHSHSNLQNISYIIAVASCKGGVGKSSIAVNLAYMLKNRGAKVGLVDVDIFGPSLNSLIPIENPRVYYESSTPSTTDSNKTDSNKAVALSPPEGGDVADGGILPLEHEGVKLVSYSYFRPKSDAYAAVRGPIAGSLALQLITTCKWGRLDYLIIDMPPGTGDIHLTLAQSIQITGAVVVTTPQKLSLIDVEKGIHFFRKMNIPTIAIVENMATIACQACGQEESIFQSVYHIGSNSSCDASKPQQTNPLDLLIKQFGVGITVKLPMDPRLSATQFIAADGQVIYPFARAFDSKNPTWRKLDSFVQNLIQEISKVVHSTDRAPEITTTNDGFLQIATSDGSISLCPLREVRLSCLCAYCTDETTSATKLNPRMIPLDVHIVKMEQSGNYSLRVNWSDDHQSLYSFEHLLKLSQQSSGGRRTPHELQSTPNNCGVDQQELLDW